MQQIVGLLIYFQSSGLRPVGEIAAWVDCRFDPLDEIMQRFAAQSHCRFLKVRVGRCLLVSKTQKSLAEKVTLTRSGDQLPAPHCSELVIATS